MPNITYILADGSKKTLDVPSGTSVMQAAVNNGIEGIVAECGGSAMCATCHVYVAPEWADKLPPINAVEEEMLESVACERTDNSRLSCQLCASPEFEGLVVTLPRTQI
jgi:2Fe-2S ferredoxin